MLYKFDKNKMNYVRAINSYLIILSAIIGSSMITFAVSMYTQGRQLDNIEYISEETRLLVIRQDNEFSETKLKEYIVDLNIRFPHIVFAQAKLESGNFKSTIFIENNNLFGMKMATRRPTTNKGTSRGHAVFDNWKESVLDYAFYQARFLGNIKTESEYIQYLKMNYAEDPGYVEKVIKLSK